MKPKEKAKELFDKFNPHVLIKDFWGDDVEHRKTIECTLIAVDEILNLLKYEGIVIGSYYWQEVKKEIEKINE